MATRKLISDELRDAIERCGISRYEICKRLDLDQGAMSNFMHGKRGLSLEVIDRVCALLALHLVSDKRRRAK